MEYNEFSDEAVTNPVLDNSSKRDILEVKFLEVARGDINETELMQLKSRSKATLDLNGPGILKRRILEFIHIRSAENLPVRLMDINRVFQHPARRCATPVKLIAQQLIDSKRIIELEQSNVSALFSKAIWDQKVEASLAIGGSGAVGMANQLMSNIGF